VGLPSPTRKAVIEHVAEGVSTPELVTLAREELRKMRHVPNEALSLQRHRFETAIKRLGDCYQWREIEEDDYRSERAKLQARLAELPPPADSNIVAFDRTGEHLLPIATIIRETTAEHQTVLIKHIVERVEIQDGVVVGIDTRPEARPFFQGLAVAPPGGPGGAQPTFLIEGVDVLVMELLAVQVALLVPAAASERMTQKRVPQPEDRGTLSGRSGFYSLGVDATGCGLAASAM
jgi:hypothetical protein